MSTYTTNNLFAVRIERDGRSQLAADRNASNALFWKWGDANKFRKELKPHINPDNKLSVVKVSVVIKELP